MKILIFGFTLLGHLSAFGATQENCLAGSFSQCREIFNQYGSQSDRKGAVQFFEKACSAQTLRVNCQVISSEKSETLQKTLELASPGSGFFVMNGSKMDKIYLISEVK